jgi:hypothetical protein
VSGQWWRRNRWGLVALVPALALAFYAPVHDFYQRYWFDKPRQPLSAASGGWVDYAGARMRLVDLRDVTHEVTDYDDKPFPLPAGVRIWRATLEFIAADSEKILGCRLAMESAAGSTFDANPNELSGADVRYAGCAPSGLGTPPPQYQTVAYFVLPSSARPVAVRVTLETLLPGYARLS